MEEIIKDIVRFAETRNMNLTELSKVIDIPYHTLRKWLDGSQKPTKLRQGYLRIKLESLKKEIPSKV